MRSVRGILAVGNLLFCNYCRWVPIYVLLWKTSTDVQVSTFLWSNGSTETESSISQANPSKLHTHSHSPIRPVAHICEASHSVRFRGPHGKWHLDADKISLAIARDTAVHQTQRRPTSRLQCIFTRSTHFKTIVDLDWKAQ